MKLVANICKTIKGSSYWETVLNNNRIGDEVNPIDVLQVFSYLKKLAKYLDFFTWEKKQKGFNLL